jgi:hypothetical protein
MMLRESDVKRRKVDFCDFAHFKHCLPGSLHSKKTAGEHRERICHTRKIRALSFMHTDPANMGSPLMYCQASGICT